MHMKADKKDGLARFGDAVVTQFCVCSGSRFGEQSVSVFSGMRAATVVAASVNCNLTESARSTFRASLRQ